MKLNNPITILTFAKVDYLKQQFLFAELEGKNLINEKLVYPSYEKCIKQVTFSIFGCKEF